jgi:hypothetical protein
MNTFISLCDFEICMGKCDLGWRCGDETMGALMSYVEGMRKDGMRECGTRTFREHSAFGLSGRSNSTSGHERPSPCPLTTVLQYCSSQSTGGSASCQRLPE